MNDEIRTQIAIAKRHGEKAMLQLIKRGDTPMAKSEMNKMYYALSKAEHVEKSTANDCAKLVSETWDLYMCYHSIIWRRKHSGK